MYDVFGLTLVLNHACNLRCTYCYTGRKFSRKLPLTLGRKALQRALSSISPKGRLELGFFGGEPLLEPELLNRILLEARALTRTAELELTTSLTTNGTVAEGPALRVLLDPTIQLSISFDGLPETHDRHRRFADGQPSSSRVRSTMRLLQDAGRDFEVATVVRPDTVSRLPGMLQFLQELGVRMVHPTLDLWTLWTPSDIDRMETALISSVAVWCAHLPDFGVSWFNEKLVKQTGLPVNTTARCSFGAGEVAVTPAGNLYPCERLVGEDTEGHPLRIPGHVWDGNDFLNLPRPGNSGSLETCGLSCRCANYVRTGSTTCPDAFLRRLDAVCEREVRQRIVRHEKITVATDCPS